VPGIARTFAPWPRSKGSNTRSISAADSIDTAALPGHSRHHVDDLYQLGLIGHVRGIQAKLREMENDPGSRPFATHMRALVANFDLKRYMHVLEGIRRHG
jgi:hypothetical protein